MRERRNRRYYPMWYYGMIILTLVSTAAGVYFRGNKVQGDLQVDRIILGGLITAFLGIATWAFNVLIKEVRNVGNRMGMLTDAVFRLETKLHPDKAELILETFQSVVRSKRNGEFREL